MLKGIDISKWQKNVDYSQLKKQGIDFAIIRCGYGRDISQKDNLFETHYKGLKEAGIKVGCYLYSYADKIEDGILEAKNCLEFIKGKTFELPVFYDLEDKITAPLGKNVITQIAKNFCDEIEKAGYVPGIYASLYWFNNLTNVEELEKYKIWLAEWGVKEPKAEFKVDYWQFTSSGKVEGIKGNVDMNICYDNSIIGENVDNFVEKSENQETYIKVGDKVKVKAGSTDYSNNRLADFVYTKIYDVIQVNGDRVVIGIGNAVTCAIDINKLILVNENTKNLKELKVGDKVKVKAGSTDYSNNRLADFVYTKIYDVIQINEDRIVIGIGNQVTCAISKNNLIKQ